MRSKISRAAIVCVAVCTGWIAFCSNALAETRVALVVGNGAYEHTTILKNPPNDSQAISASLKQLGFTVIEGRDLTRTAFKEKLKEFAAAISGSDIALLFYAGHGLQVEGENWLIPTDTDVRSEMDLELGAISLATVLKTMERGARVRLVLLDACRDNPMSTQLAQGLGNRSGSVGRGLARVEAGAGTLIAYSTQPGAVASDGRGSNSPFATALLSAMPTPGLEIRQLLTRVRQQVIEATEQQQVPWDHSSLMDDLYLVPGKPGTAPLPTPAIATPAVTLDRRQADVMRQMFMTIRDTQYGPAILEKLKGDDYEGVIRLTTEALAAHPEDGNLLVFRGFANGALHKCEEAIPDMRRAKALNLPKASRYIAHIFLAICEYGNIEDATAAIELFPDFPKAYDMRSLAYEEHGRYAEALSDIDKYLELAPEDKSAFHQIRRGGLTCLVGDLPAGRAILKRVRGSRLSDEDRGHLKEYEKDCV
jgi:tetratricopeptide (TPR) repeat protein